MFEISLNLPFYQILKKFNKYTIGVLNLNIYLGPRHLGEKFALKILLCEKNLNTFDRSRAKHTLKI